MYKNKIYINDNSFVAIGKSNSGEGKRVLSSGFRWLVRLDFMCLLLVEGLRL